MSQFSIRMNTETQNVNTQNETMCHWLDRTRSLIYCVQQKRFLAYICELPFLRSKNFQSLLFAKPDEVEKTGVDLISAKRHSTVYNNDKEQLTIAMRDLILFIIWWYQPNILIFCKASTIKWFEFYKILGHFFFSSYKYYVLQCT